MDKETKEFLENMMKQINSNFNSIEDRFEKLENKVDLNHKEVMSKLNKLEKNQEAIKNFILNSDETFKKAEMSYEFIEKLRKL